jgi:hypothetical protein
MRIEDDGILLLTRLFQELAPDVSLQQLNWEDAENEIEDGSSEPHWNSLVTATINWQR